MDFIACLGWHCLSPLYGGKNFSRRHVRTHSYLSLKRIFKCHLIFSKIFNFFIIFEQEVIKEGVMHLPREKLKKFSDLRFRYVEETEPEEFFIPYVWTLVYRSSTLYWNSTKITLFDPKTSDQL